MSYTNNNQALTKEIQVAGGLNNITGYPRNIAESIVPVIPLNTRKDFILGSNGSASTGNISLFTCPTTKRTFVTGVLLSIAKDVTCDKATGAFDVSVTPLGAGSKSIVAISTITLTAQSQTVVATFANPIELSPGTSVLIGGSFTAGACYRTANVYGYYEDQVGA